MAIPSRGVKNLRTFAGRVDQVAIPYRAYMTVSCLEMEKARRNQERKSARQRITDIDVRIAEIEAQKAALLRSAGDVIQHKPLDDGTSEPRPAPRQGKREFKIKY